MFAYGTNIVDMTAFQSDADSTVTASNFTFQFFASTRSVLYVSGTDVVFGEVPRELGSYPPSDGARRVRARWPSGSARFADPARGRIRTNPQEAPHRPPRSRDRRVASSTITLVASTATVGALGVVVLHAMTHRLGTDAYGELVIVLAFISSTLLFTDLGINSYSGREIARRKADASVILGQNLGLRLVFSLVMIPTVIALGEAIYPHRETALLEGIALVSLTLPFEAFRAVSLSYYVATIQNYKTAVINVVTQIIYVSGALTALYLGFGIIGCFVAYDISVVATAAIAFLAVRRSVAFAPMLAIGSWRGRSSASHWASARFR